MAVALKRIEGKEIDLGQITDDIVMKWPSKYEKCEGGYCCKDCGATIMQTTVFISVHDKRFARQCAGSGEVQKINFPYCPKCDGEPKMVRACVHV